MSSELPRQIDHQWKNNHTDLLATSMPSGRLRRPLGEDFDSALEAALGLYHESEDRYPYFAHFKMEPRVVEGHTVLVPVEVWGPENSWIPAVNSLDATITVDVSGRCNQVIDEIWYAARDAVPVDVAGGGPDTHIQGFREERPTWTCSATGTKTGRALPGGQGRAQHPRGVQPPVPAFLPPVQG